MRIDPWLVRVVGGATFLGAGAVNWIATGTFAGLYNLPVAVAAAGDGWRGGLLAAALSATAVFCVPGDLSVFSCFVHSAALFGVALVVALLVDRERERANHFRKTTEQLSTVYEKVQTNFESLKRVERLSALGQLSAGLAHEIRNPLASIAGAAEILRRKDEPDPKHARCIDIITSESRRLDGLLTNFLDFARPRPPRLQTIRLDAVLDNVLLLAGHGIRGKAVHCEKVAPADMPPVECDAEQLEQVLLNLVINAMEASPDGKTVTLSASAADGQVSIQVVDRGHGVAAAHVDRLFDPFFTTKEHGTGLGLPVAHQIMTQMGGTLLAQRNIGEGMTFTVLLPARHGDA
jgi:two-component system, NtrC family, sensor histidine kinase HydH